MNPFDAYLSIDWGLACVETRVFWRRGVYFCNATGARVGLFSSHRCFSVGITVAVVILVFVVVVFVVLLFSFAIGGGVASAAGAFAVVVVVLADTAFVIAVGLVFWFPSIAVASVIVSVVAPLVLLLLAVAVVVRVARCGRCRSLRILSVPSSSIAAASRLALPFSTVRSRHYCRLHTSRKSFAATRIALTLFVAPSYRYIHIRTTATGNRPTSILDTRSDKGPGHCDLVSRCAASRCGRWRGEGDSFER